MAAERFVHRYPLGQPTLSWRAADPPNAGDRPRPYRGPRRNLWTFALTLLDALATETAFTLDPIAWRPVARSATGRPTHFDIDGDNGWTDPFR